MLEVSIFFKSEKTEQVTRFKEGPASKGLKCYAFVCIYTRRCVYTSTSTTCIL